MRKLLLLAPLLLAVVALAGPWDASFSRVGQVVSSNPTSANLTVFPGAYVKVSCDVAAYIGQGIGGSSSCTSTTCDRYAAGERFYARLNASEDTIAVLAVAGTATCQVFQAKGQ